MHFADAASMWTHMRPMWDRSQTHMPKSALICRSYQYAWHHAVLLCSVRWYAPPCHMTKCPPHIGEAPAETSFVKLCSASPLQFWLPSCPLQSLSCNAFMPFSPSCHCEGNNSASDLKGLTVDSRSLLFPSRSLLSPQVQHAVICSSLRCQNSSSLINSQHDVSV